MRDVYIVSAVRTPVGRRNGYLREWKAPELLGTILDEVCSRIDLDPNLVEDVINGTVYQVGEQGFTLAGPPEEFGPGGDEQDPAFLALKLGGTLSPAISADGRSIDFAVPGGARVLRYAELKVTDVGLLTVTSFRL